VRAAQARHEPPEFIDVGVLSGLLQKPSDMPALLIALTRRARGVQRRFRS
jgi:hypothetical protein